MKDEINLISNKSVPFNNLLGGKNLSPDLIKYEKDKLFAIHNIPYGEWLPLETIAHLLGKDQEGDTTQLLDAMEQEGVFSYSRKDTYIQREILKGRNLHLQEHVDPKRRNLIVDFDGVLNAYKKSLHSAEQHFMDDRYDFPVPGALEWVLEMLEDFNVIIFTARHVSPGGLDEVRAWLKKWDFPDLPVTGVKPIGVIYLDDRGINFNGNNFPTKEFISSFRPWNRE